tara:strand:+ start:2862 stop:3680 length:819 start_codon:yes stop_codon:yes gene_type:complete
MVFRKDALNSTNVATTLGDDGLVLSSASPLMRFSVSSGGGLPSTSGFDTSNYTATNDNWASGIFRTGVGEYTTVLDGQISLSGGWQGSPLANTASSVADYVDIWTVKISEGDSFQTLINNFHLYGDTIFTLTEPLLLKTKTHLVNRHINIGSKVNLKFTNDITVENKNITQDIANIFNDSAITTPLVEIKKVNEDVNLPSRVTVSSFDATGVSSLVRVTSDNTIVFPLDTLGIQSVLTASGGGAVTGTYTAQVKFTLINEVILSPLFHFIVR